MTNKYIEKIASMSGLSSFAAKAKDFAGAVSGKTLKNANKSLAASKATFERATKAHDDASWDYHWDKTKSIFTRKGIKPDAMDKAQALKDGAKSVMHDDELKAYRAAQAQTKARKITGVAAGAVGTTALAGAAVAGASSGEREKQASIASGVKNFVKNVSGANLAEARRTATKAADAAKFNTLFRDKFKAKGIEVDNKIRPKLKQELHDARMAYKQVKNETKIDRIVAGAIATGIGGTMLASKSNRPVEKQAGLLGSAVTALRSGLKGGMSAGMQKSISTGAIVGGITAKGEDGNSASLGDRLKGAVTGGVLGGALNKGMSMYQGARGASMMRGQVANMTSKPMLAGPAARPALPAPKAPLALGGQPVTDLTPRMK